MPTDLTERLAAKLQEDPRVWVNESIASWAAEILPLLLSEPELVAGLPEEVRIDLLCQLTSAEVRLRALTPRERAVMKLGEAAFWCAEAGDASETCYTVFGTPEECAAFYARVGYTEADALAVERELTEANREHLAALAEVRALTPEGKDG